MYASLLLLFLISMQKSVQISGDHDFALEEVKETIREIPFLCALPKPANFPLRWAGEDSAQTGRLVCASELATRGSAWLVSATVFIADDERMSYNVKNLLGLQTRKASLEQVMNEILF